MGFLALVPKVRFFMQLWLWGFMQKQAGEGGRGVGGVAAGGGFGGVVVGPFDVCEAAGWERDVCCVEALGDVGERAGFGGEGGARGAGEVGEDFEFGG